MDLRGGDFPRSAHAPAKLNLFMDVLGRRGDGYHDLETLMVPIRLFDDLTFTSTSVAAGKPAGELKLTIQSAWPVRPPPYSDDIPSGNENLVIRALNLFRQRSGCNLGATIRLVKRIPMAAGLGGGSSDAATALRLANRGWRINWGESRLLQLASELGSDIPFFLSRGAAICRGRGERIERLPPLPGYHFVVVKPAVSLHTPDVFRAHDTFADSEPRSAAGQVNRLVANLYLRGWQEISVRMHNQLQTAAASLSPVVEKLRTVFGQLDFVAHQLSGSGSAYFGLCRHAQQARRFANVLRTQQLGLVYATRSCP